MKGSGNLKSITYNRSMSPSNVLGPEQGKLTKYENRYMLYLKTPVVAS